MRLAKSPRTLLPLALSAVLATCVLAQDQPTVKPSTVRDQVVKQLPGNSTPPSAPKAPAPAPAPAPAKSSGPGAATAPAKAAPKVPANAVAKAPAKAPDKAPD